MEEFTIPIMGQYEYIIDKSHPRANKEGQVYLHIVKAEEKLGRKLLENEVVHHIDLNKTNNDLDNLIVFATKSDHSSFHQNGCESNTLILQENGSYKCLHKLYQCVDCGASITHRAKRCVPCMRRVKESRIPTKDELRKKLFINKGKISKTGREYGVTSNAVKKWCQKYAMPYYSLDYLNQVVRSQ